MELMEGFCLLGMPVGSPRFADEFFEERLAKVRQNVKVLKKGVPNLQCAIQKLPYLPGADIMHNLEDEYFEDGSNWWDWNGPLTNSINKIIQSFLETLVEQERLPKYAFLISQTSAGMGGLGLLNPSYQSAPDFVINVTSSMKCATNGIRPNKDLAPLQFCPSIGALYSQELNPDST